MAKFFTKKVCLITLAVVIALGGIVWAVIANITPKFHSGIDAIPAANYVSGNGTASVMVDNYLYFVGGVVKKSDIKYGDNEYYANGKVSDAGIYRVKIGDNGVPVLDYEYDNTYTDEETEEKKEWQVGDKNYNSVVTKIKDWENIGKKNNGVEAVVPKIAGHDQTAMWVFGKYLIYVTPHNRYDNRGNLMSDYLDFFRVDLDGKNHTLIYTSDSTDLTTKNFTVWADATDNIFLLVSETDNKSDKAEPQIKKINVVTKTVTILDRNVKDVVLPSATQYGKQNESLSQIYSGVMSYVYYTKARDENSTLKGNLLYRCAINGGEPEVIAERGDAEKGTTFTPLAVTPYGVASAQFVFSISVTAGSATFIEKDLCAITNQNLETFHYEDPEINGAGLGLKSDSKVAIYANGFCTIDGAVYHYNIVDSRIVLDGKLSSVTVDNVLAVMGDTIYVQSTNTVNIINADRTSTRVSTVITADDDSASSENSAENTENNEEKETAKNVLPLGVIYQPQGNTGDPMIYVQDADSIRLYSTDQTYKYLRIKAE